MRVLDTIKANLEAEPATRAQYRAAVETMTRAELVDLLAEALPFVEEGAADPCHKASGKARCRKLAADMRRAVEEHEAATFDPSKCHSFHNFPTFAAGDVVMVPDGYEADGTARPWVRCTVVEQRIRMLIATNPDGRQITCPAYGVRLP